MIDILTEKAIGLAEAAKLYPSFREGKRFHPATVLRHIMKGVVTRSGGRVCLEGAKLGGKWITSAEAMRRVMERLTADSLNGDQTATSSAVQMTNEQRLRIERMRSALKQAGF
jgi:Protein of unknown function (DUF1580)